MILWLRIQLTIEIHGDLWFYPHHRCIVDCKQFLKVHEIDNLLIVQVVDMLESAPVDHNFPLDMIVWDEMMGYLLYDDLNSPYGDVDLFPGYGLFH